MTGPDADDGPADGSGLFSSQAARRDALRRSVVLLVALLGTTGALTVLVPELTDAGWLRAQLAGLGAYAPLAFVALQTVQVILAPIPGQVLGGVGGYLFGTLAGTVYSMLGVTLGSAIVFVLARRRGRPYVERVVDDAALARWDAIVERGGTGGLFVLFLLPTFPDDLLCLVAGLSTVRTRTFLALVIVGRTPSFLAVAYAGQEAASGQFRSVAAVLTALALASAVVYLLKDRVLARLQRRS
ncbi:TVP38/TMEM64 family protein [Halomicroarcula sp. GCM10025709]|uniref:TVP38/TMEM64 family protein n=1 Tax=Haloarcula TaxID=2237 RepID=UPI0024C46531|nr:TVP38/TMEM64 family protein [Halomicroarcula sp. YJ-61-S]